jgi:hypothetical protein
MKHQSKFGEVPKLTLRQKILLKINGEVFIGYKQGIGDHGKVPVFVVHCSEHGNYLDTPHGWCNYFSCDECFDERIQKCHVPATAST